MFNADKDVESINHPSTSIEQNSFNEQRFPSGTSQVDQISIPNQLIPVMPNHKIDIQKFPFRFHLYNQFIKAFSVFYLAFGIMMATSFFIHTTFNILDKPYDSWNWIGITNFVFIFINSVSIIFTKIFIYQNPLLVIKRKFPVNDLLFYLIIVISAALSFFSLIFILLENLNCFRYSTVIADILLPISRLIFIIIGFIIIADLMNYEIKCTIDGLAFFFFYKFTAMFTLVTFLNTISFEFLHSLTISLGIKKPLCKGINYNFDNISNTMQNYFNVFSLIFSIVSVIICFEPLKQFYQIYLQQTGDDEHQPLLSKNCHSSPRKIRFISKNFSLTIVIGVLVFLLVGFIVPVKLLNKYNTTQENIKITANSSPIFSYLLCGLIDIWLLKLLYEKYHFVQKSDLKLTYKYVLWASSFGMVLCVFRNFVDNLDKINDYSGKILIIKITGIFVNIVNMIESILQTMAIDHLLMVNWNCLIKRKKLSRIFNCCVILIAFNSGCFIVDYYDQTGNDIFKPIEKQYNIFTWAIITTLINPLTLIYRIFVPIVLWKFCSRLKCEELELGEQN